MPRTKRFRYAPCVVCKAFAENGERSHVDKGRCWIREVGDVCVTHFHKLQDAPLATVGLSP